MTDDPEGPSDEPTETYAGAPESLIEIWNQRRRRLKLAARDWFPPADLDLAPLLSARIPADLPALEGPQTLHAKKLHQMRVELRGKPELAVVNAILIAHLRKKIERPGLPRLIHTRRGEGYVLALPEEAGLKAVPTP